VHTIARVSAKLFDAAAEVVGGEAELALYLGAPEGEIHAWRRGRVPPPIVVLRVVDVVLTSRHHADALASEVKVAMDRLRGGAAMS
jgi:hypothetical protein